MAERPKTNQRSRRIKALLSLGMVAGLGAVGTLAAWTDTATATATFTTGTLDLKLKDTAAAGAVADNVTFTSLTMSGMYPGTSKAAMLDINNAGTVPLAYTLAGTAADGPKAGLGGALTVSIYAGGAASNASSVGSCSGTLIGTADRPLVGPLIPAARTLAAAGTEQLCVKISLPATAANSLQGTTTTASLAFTASLGS